MESINSGRYITPLQSYRQSSSLRYTDILSKPHYTANNIIAKSLRLDTRTGISQYFKHTEGIRIGRTSPSRRLRSRGHLRPVLNPRVWTFQPYRVAFSEHVRWDERGKSSSTTRRVISIASCKAANKNAQIIIAPTKFYILS